MHIEKSTKDECVYYGFRLLAIVFNLRGFMVPCHVKIKIIQDISVAQCTINLHGDFICHAQLMHVRVTVTLLID